MSKHKVKILPLYFEAVISGVKTFEIRKADRDYKIGDTLLLREYNSVYKKYTGRKAYYVITYVLLNVVGLESGYCILGIKLKAYE